ncbi:hypothetical protein SAMN05421677_12527 [Halobacillus aidingensis]|uniref:Uncharacterized protein n=2 Tax=Halobacillus aidingensis TaxID=240303 RepID=A0A1H0UBI0_HALAD|nr:hypothetical protein SAMN05421677_12527 [Halobacillus aidingensis]
MLVLKGGNIVLKKQDCLIRKIIWGLGCMAIFEFILDVLGKSKVVVHITRNSGDSLKVQQILQDAGKTLLKKLKEWLLPISK